MNERIERQLEAIADDPTKRMVVTAMLDAFLFWARFTNWIKGGGAI